MIPTLDYIVVRNYVFNIQRQTKLVTKKYLIVVVCIEGMLTKRKRSRERSERVWIVR